MIDWTKSYESVWRVFRVDASTWSDAEQVRGVDSISVTRSCATDKPMLESGSMTITGDAFERGYYRVVMNAVQGAQSQRVDIATLLCESTKNTSNYGTRQFSVSCNSVLYPASTQSVLDGLYVPAGANCAEFAASMLRSCVKAPVNVMGDGYTLTEHYWFEFGTRILDAVWTLLNLGGYVLQIDGRGEIAVKPQPTESALTLDGANVALLGAAVTNVMDTSDVPNRYIAKSDRAVVIAVNNDPDSPVSTIARGYYYDEVDDSPATIGTETLADYAVRRLEELSTGISDVRTYTREYYPDVYPGDLITGTLDSIGVNGTMRVVNQSLTCNQGVTVSEQAAKEVKLWQQ